MRAKLPSQRRDVGEAPLWHIGTALAVSFTVAVFGLVGLVALAWLLLGLAGFRRHGAPSLHDTVGVLQLVFASVAGAGALVALIVAYRRQKVAESTAALDRASAQLERTRVHNERFTAAAAQLGDDKPAIRLAGVHAMAGLADDWPENRQTCVDVLCAYLRMPYTADPGENAPAEDRLMFASVREVRHTVIRVITAHLRDTAPMSWRSLDFDFTGVVFDGGDFSGAVFSSGRISFVGTEFSSGQINFEGAVFSDAQVGFVGAGFSGGLVSFGSAVFSGGQVSFESAVFSGGQVSFLCAEFSGAEVSMASAVFSGGEVSFSLAVFSGGQVSFGFAVFSGGQVSFGSAVFSGGQVSFERAVFSGGQVSFRSARFSGGLVLFGHAGFSGGQVSFVGAEFSGGELDFSNPYDWSHQPKFDWSDTPPAWVKVKLPGQRDASPPNGVAGGADSSKPAGS